MHKTQNILMRAWGNFAVRWLVFSALLLSFDAVRNMLDLRRWPTGNVESFADWFESFVSNPLPLLIVSALIGFFAAKHFGNGSQNIGK